MASQKSVPVEKIVAIEDKIKNMKYNIPSEVFMFFVIVFSFVWVLAFRLLSIYQLFAAVLMSSVLFYALGYLAMVSEKRVIIKKAAFPPVSGFFGLAIERKVLQIWEVGLLMFLVSLIFAFFTLIRFIKV